MPLARRVLLRAAGRHDRVDRRWWVIDVVDARLDLGGGDFVLRLGRGELLRRIVVDVDDGKLRYEYWRGRGMSC